MLQWSCRQKSFIIIIKDGSNKRVDRKELIMSKAFETAKAELKAIYNQLTKEEKLLVQKRKQELIEARDTKKQNIKEKE